MKKREALVKTAVDEKEKYKIKICRQETEIRAINIKLQDSDMENERRLTEVIAVNKEKK